MHVKVVIIGAGMAGLSAAHELWRQNFRDFLILEARDRIGGRINTIHVPTEVDGSGTKALELGAEWIHGACEEHTVYQLAKRYGYLGDQVGQFPRFLNLESEPNEVRMSDGSKISNEAVKLANSIYDRIACQMQEHFEKDVKHLPEYPDLEPYPISDFFDQEVNAHLADIGDEQVRSQVKCVLNACRIEMAQYVGTELNISSYHLYGSSIEIPAEDAPIPQGLDKIVQNLGREFVQSHLYLNSRVALINYENEDKIVIKYNESRTMTCDYVIVTIPIGVLKENHQSLFQPEIPGPKIKAMELMDHGCLAKIFVQFDPPFWDCQSGFSLTLAWKDNELMEKDDKLQWIKGISNFRQNFNHKDILECFVSGKNGFIADTLPDDKIKIDITNVLRGFIGDKNLECPKQIFRTKWTQEEFTLGTYSHPKIGMQRRHLQELCQPLPDFKNPRIFFSGEAYSPDNWSNLHGARLSGLQASAEIMKRL